jgi:uncharacterized membrane protein YccC
MKFFPVMSTAFSTLILSGLTAGGVIILATEFARAQTSGSQNPSALSDRELRDALGACLQAQVTNAQFCSQVSNEHTNREVQRALAEPTAQPPAGSGSREVSQLSDQDLQTALQSCLSSSTLNPAYCNEVSIENTSRAVRQVLNRNQPSRSTPLPPPGQPSTTTSEMNWRIPGREDPRCRGRLVVPLEGGYACF